jgi:hypothetical protein
VSYFPNYKHKESDEQEAKTKKLRVLIFMFWEYLRMNISIKSTSRLIDKAHYWGDICLQLLKWRARHF